MGTVALLLSLVAAGLRLTAAGIFYERLCPTHYEVKQNFSLDAYHGRWYEMQRYDNFHQETFDCVEGNYTLGGDQEMWISYMAHNLERNVSKVFSTRGVISFPNEEIIQGKLNVSGTVPDRSNYWVLDTDYVTYSVVWSCRDWTENLSEEGFWLLSRTRYMPTIPDALLRIYSIIRRYIDRSQIRFTRQLDERCPEF